MARITADHLARYCAARPSKGGQSASEWQARRSSYRRSRQPPATSANATSAIQPQPSPTSPTSATSVSAAPSAMPVCRRIRAARAAMPARAMSARRSHNTLEAHPGQPGRRCQERQQGRQCGNGEQEAPDREAWCGTGAPSRRLRGRRECRRRKGWA